MKVIKFCTFLVLSLGLIQFISCNNPVSDSSDSNNNSSAQENNQNADEKEDEIVYPYSITYKLNGGEWISDYKAQPGYTGDADFELPGALNLTKRGYDFKGWYDKADIDMELTSHYLSLLGGGEEDTGLEIVPVTKIQKGATENKVFYAVWELSNYSITYCFDDAASWKKNFNPKNSYTMKEEIFLPNSNDISKKNYQLEGWYLTEDFSGDKVTCIKRDSVGNVKLYAKWKPSEFSISYYLNGGSWKDEEKVISTYTIEDNVLLPDASQLVKSGYGFAGWYEDSLFTDEPVIEFDRGTTGNKTLFAKWIEGASKYTVRHLQQNIEDDEYTEVEQQEFSGMTNTTTNAVPRKYTGFTSKPVFQKTITPDGNTVVEVYYDRNIHRLIYNDGVEGEEIDVPAERLYRYGTKVIFNFTDIGERAGYIFGAWKDEAGNTSTFAFMEDSDISLYAVWQSEPREYTVKHLKQCLVGDEYEEVEEDRSVLTGFTDDYTKAKAKEYKGFTVNPFEQKKIKADGSTVIELKYDRLVCKINYFAEIDGEEVVVPEPAEYRYGNEIELNYDDIDSGEKLTFIGWKSQNNIYKKLDNAKFLMQEPSQDFTAVWAINPYAYENDTELTSYIVPESVVEIGDYAFSGCKNLSTITIHKNVEVIGDSVLDGCSKLEKVEAPIRLFKSFNGIQNIVEVIINDDVGIISQNLFYCWTKLKSVELPESVRLINDSAFYGCSSLESIVIPDNVEYVGENTFADCTSLKSVKIGKKLRFIDKNAFRNCSNMESYSVSKDNTVYASKDGILYSKDLKTLKKCPAAATKCIVPKGVTTIENDAFYECRKLEEFEVSKFISFDYSELQNCNTLTYVTAPINCIPENENIISAKALIFDFNQFGWATPKQTQIVTEIVFDEEFKNEYATIELNGYTNLKKIYISSTMSNFPFTRIKNCDIEISENNPWLIVENHAVLINQQDNRICFNKFLNYTTEEIANYSIPESVTEIESFAFDGCDNVICVSIPKDVDSISGDAFYNSGIKKLIIDDENPYYSFENETLFRKGDHGDLVNLVKVLDYKDSEYVVPDGIQTISYGSFEGCKSVITLRIPSSVNHIANDVYENSNIANLIIDENNPFYKINDHALFRNEEDKIDMLKFFNYTTDDFEYEIPEDVNFIYSHCFSGISNMKSIIIPQSVNQIGYGAIDGTTITTIKYRGSMEQWYDVYKEYYWDCCDDEEQKGYKVIFNYTE